MPLKAIIALTIAAAAAAGFALPVPHHDDPPPVAKTRLLELGA